MHRSRTGIYKTVSVLLLEDVTFFSFLSLSLSFSSRIFPPIFADISLASLDWRFRVHFSRHATRSRLVPTSNLPKNGDHCVNFINDIRPARHNDGSPDKRIRQIFVVSLIASSIFQTRYSFFISGDPPLEILRCAYRTSHGKVIRACHNSKNIIFPDSEWSNDTSIKSIINFGYRWMVRIARGKYYKYEKCKVQFCVSCNINLKNRTFLARVASPCDVRCFFCIVQNFGISYRISHSCRIDGNSDKFRINDFRISPYISKLLLLESTSGNFIERNVCISLSVWSCRTFLRAPLLFLRKAAGGKNFSKAENMSRESESKITCTSREK